MSLKKARIRAGKTVQEVMKEFDVSDAAVYFWETGRTQPRVRLLPRLAEFYGCTVDELLSEDD